MITFWTDERGRSHFQTFLKNRTDATYPAIAVARYEELGPRQTLTASAHVFSALDQLTPAGVTAVESIWDQVGAAAPGVRLLNDPRKVLHRYELLEALSEAGLNSFRAFRAAGDLARVRFPAFIREERRHNGIGSLLHNRAELDRALTALLARGFRRDELLVVEFCDTSGGSGFFRKYGALKIGERILPRHMMLGREWMLKSENNRRTVDAAREQLDYVNTNPHEAWLREVFAIARIDYGRIDYAVLGGRPQAWEINLDPALGGGGSRSREAEASPEYKRLAQERRAVAARAMAEAWHALERGRPAAGTVVVLDRGVLRGIRRERREKRFREKTLAIGQWFADRPVLGWPLRWTYRRLFPNPTIFRT